MKIARARGLEGFIVVAQPTIPKTIKTKARVCFTEYQFEKSSKQTQESSRQIRLQLLHQKFCQVSLAVLAIKTHQRPRLPPRYLD